MNLISPILAIFKWYLSLEYQIEELSQNDILCNILVGRLELHLPNINPELYQIAWILPSENAFNNYKEIHLFPSNELPGGSMFLIRETDPCFSLIANKNEIATINFLIYGYRFGRKAKLAFLFCSPSVFIRYQLYRFAINLI